MGPSYTRKPAPVTQTDVAAGVLLFMISTPCVRPSRLHCSRASAAQQCARGVVPRLVQRRLASLRAGAAVSAGLRATARSTQKEVRRRSNDAPRSSPSRPHRAPPAGAPHRACCTSRRSAAVSCHPAPRHRTCIRAVAATHRSTGAGSAAGATGARQQHAHRSWRPCRRRRRPPAGARTRRGRGAQPGAAACCRPACARQRQRGLAGARRSSGATHASRPRVGSRAPLQQQLHHRGVPVVGGPRQCGLPVLRRRRISAPHTLARHASAPHTHARCEVL
jgi:hypothetical protein